MRKTLRRIAQLLTTRYQVTLDPASTGFTSVQLGELDLDSLSLLSFLADVEREFRLRFEELERVARRDCTLGTLGTLCRAADLRAQP